jgi:large subunit ribosomal protein L23
MNKEQLLQVLLSPIVSEKSATLADANRQYVFKVRTDADKRDIRKAVELLFEVKVERVQVINVKGKSKRFGRVMGKRSDWKKALVRLKEGQEIDFGLGV